MLYVFCALCSCTLKMERTTAFNMDGKTLTLVLVICLNYVYVVSTETTVEVSSPLNSVAVGGVLAVQCQIWNMEERYTVTIVHTSTTQSKLISTNKDIQSSSPQASRAFLAVRTFSDGSVVYFLTLLDVTLADHGEYSCTVSSLFGGSFSDIAKHTKKIEVVSFPDDTQPICSSKPSKLALQVVSPLELVCTSQKTYPMVDLKWRLLSSYKIVPSLNTTTLQSVSSTLRLRTEMKYNGAFFECEMTSRSFPDRIRTCKIGPITVTPSDGSISDGIDSGSIDQNVPDIVDSLQTEGPLITGDCIDKCTSSSQTVFYLIISTAAASLLLIIFFATTIVMCCKYYGSSAASSRQYMTPTPVVDPVNVSLQRRRENERVYMTLEDPNNPDGKVLLPKEVFDEFYNRTLSLKKT